MMRTGFVLGFLDGNAIGLGCEKGRREEKRREEKRREEKRREEKRREEAA